MARPLRITYEGAVYHVTVRGNNRNNIFRTDRDRERFISKLAESCRLYDIRLYLFCLMTNHVHLVLETPKANLSRFMHRLQTAYTVYFNRKNNQSGHLFQGRFGSSVVDEDDYILKLSRYIHLNPVFVKAHQTKSDRERIEILRNYLWSSYRSYIGKCNRLDFVDYAPILEMMGRPKRKQNAVYRRFVEGGIRDIDAAFVETKRSSRFCIGSGQCQERVKGLYESLVKAYDNKEDVSFGHTGEYVSAETIVKVALETLQVKRGSLKTRGMNSMVRPVVAYSLCQYGGFTQRQAADIMNLRSGAAVSLQIKRLHEQLLLNTKLRSTLENIQAQLESLNYRNSSS